MSMSPIRGDAFIIVRRRIVAGRCNRQTIRNGFQNVQIKQGGETEHQEPLPGRAVAKYANTKSLSAHCISPQRAQYLRASKLRDYKMMRGESQVEI